MLWYLLATTSFLGLAIMLVFLSVWQRAARLRRYGQWQAELGKLMTTGYYGGDENLAEWLPWAEMAVTLNLSPEELDTAFAGRRPTRFFSRTLQSGLEGLAALPEEARDPRTSRQLLGHLVLLGKAPNPDLLLALVSCLLDADPAVVGRAALAIGLHPTAYPGAAVAVIEALRAPERGTRPALTWCLRHLLKARPKLFRLLEEEPSPEIRRVLMEEMVRVLEQDAGADLAETASVIAEAAAVDPDPGVRRHAFEALRHARTERHDVCLAALDDPDPEVRAAASRALASLGDEALAALVDKVAHGEDSVRRGVLEALGRVDGDGLPEGVLDHVRTGNPSARSWALEALATVAGEAAVEELAGALDDVSTEVRVSAARALAKLAFDDACRPALRRVEPRLVERIGRESEPLALVALAETMIQTGGEDAGNAVISRLASQEDSVRERLLETLAWYEQHPIQPESPPARRAPPSS